MFKTCYEKMKDPCPINPITDHVSAIEDCQVFTIPDLLKMMVGSSMDKILNSNFDGAYPEEHFDDEEDVLERNFAFEDDSADACDVFAENIALQLRAAAENEKKLKTSAGDVNKQQSQADTSSTAKGGIDVDSTSSTANGGMMSKQGKDTTD